ncbi:MAG: type I secretion system permease/ATPase [Lachnospiraceae bacterium]|nr:type I secretion system permease/ATPase [Lachnospiraceae bacterium]
MKKVDSGLNALLIVVKFLGINIGRRQVDNIIESSPDGFDEIDIVNASRRLGLKAKVSRLTFDKLKEFNTPIIVRKNDGEFIIIAKANEDKVMIFSMDKGSENLTRTELDSIWDGNAILISKKGILDKDAIFSFKWFIPTIFKFKREFVEVLVATLTIQIISLLTPMMTQVVVDKVLVHKALSTLHVLTIGLAVCYIFELVLGLAKNYLFTHTTNRIDVMLSSKLFKHLFSLPLRYFENRRVGETVARVRELDSIRNFLTGTPLSSMIDLVFIIVYIVVLFFYSVPLTFVVIASIPFFAIVSIVITPLFKKRLDEKFNAGAEAQSFLVESITGVQTVKSYAIETKLERKWGELQSEYVKAGYKTSMVAATANSLGQFIQRCFDLIILFLGTKMVMKGEFTVGQLVAFRMLAGRVSGPVLRFVQLWQEYQQAALSVKRIGDIFNTAPEPTVDPNKAPLPYINGRIAFENVRFRYRVDSPEVIRNMNFVIEPGTVVGVVGRSGSGKSTISKLIQRLYIPEAGKITVDGIDISLADPLWLRRQIGVVLQENFMFNGTVSENIAIHCKNAKMEQIINAAKIAGAHDFILSLQEGYDTIIGEKGVGLSGGQKQRIAIARAILNNPRILIFDEATSALDYESESIIQKNLKNICLNRTVIIIAHRLSTLKDADKIMFVDNGDIAEYDTQENLIASKGLYYHLLNQQRRGEIDE